MSGGDCDGGRRGGIRWVLLGGERVGWGRGVLGKEGVMSGKSTGFRWRKVVAGRRILGHHTDLRRRKLCVLHDGKG